jgi:hypothetical protein
MLQNYSHTPLFFKRKNMTRSGVCDVPGEQNCHRGCWHFELGVFLHELVRCCGWRLSSLTEQLPIGDVFFCFRKLFSASSQFLHSFPSTYCISFSPNLTAFTGIWSH